MASPTISPVVDGATTVLRFPHSKDELRRITVKDGTGEYDVYRLAPVISHWPAADVPDEVNPRSHSEECLNSAVAKAIEDTLRKYPEDFWLSNRGGYILADRVKFDPNHSMVEITLTDPEIHGIADGATTNTIIAKLQKEWKETKDVALGEALANARFNLDVVVGLTDHERIEKLVQGRNRSVQVKEWSLADFKGHFDWLKDLIDRPEGPYASKIGWEENSGKAVTVLDLISYMTVFHPAYSDPADRRRKAPTIAFSSKGTANGRLADPKLADGFRKLTPVIEDILYLHDYIYSNFDKAYERFNKEVHNKASKLGKRRGFEPKTTILPLTGMESAYRIDKGIIFPLLSAFRALLDFTGKKAKWITNPQKFFDDHGSDLMELLIDHYELARGNPATVGKTGLAYTGLYNEAWRLLQDSESDD